MAKSRARFLAELLNASGLVQRSKSALAGEDSTVDLDALPTIPNTKLEHSSVSLAGHTLSLGGTLTLDTADIGEHASYLYYTDARARAAISVSGDLSYNSTTGVISYTIPTTIASLSNHDTADLAEGTNLYYTDARVGSYLTSNSYATQSYVGTQIANLVDSAPGTLDTLNELAAALGDDPNFATTVTNSIATKLPLAGGTMTGTLNMGANAITSTGTIQSTNSTIGAASDVGDLGNAAFLAGTTSSGIGIDSNEIVSKGAILYINQNTGSSIKFYTGDSGTSSNGLAVEIDASKDVNISAGNLQFGSTAVIDSSRNLTNIGTYTGTGQLTVGPGSFAVQSDANITVREGNAFAGIDLKSTRTAGNIGGLRSYNASNVLTNQILLRVDGKVNISNSGGLMINDSTVIDESRNLTNIGSFSASADSTITGGRLTITDDTDALRIRTTNNGAGATIAFSDNVSAYSQIGYLTYYHVNASSYGSGNAFVFSDTESSLSVAINGKLITKDGLYIGSSPSSAGTQVIDSSRNLTNIGTISSTGLAHVQNPGTNSVQTIVACLGSTSSRPVLQFSESAGTSITSGMSLEYDGRGSGDNNSMVINSVSGSSVFRVYSGGDTEVYGDLLVDNGQYTEILVKADDDGTAQISLYGDSQGTGRVYVGQSSTYGGGIEYNGDGSPATSGAGSDYITLFRTEGGTTSWTARNKYSNNDWQFRGDVTAYASDARLKENVTTITDALEKVQRLRGVEFDWKDECEELGFMPSLKHETGVIAQEVQAVIPDAAYPAPFDNDYLTVQKDKIVPLLIEAIKELKAEVDDLKAQLKE
jgi:hypothetical protein